MSDLHPIDLSGIATSRLDEYFGLWAIDASRGLAMFERIRGMDLKAHVEAADKPRPTAGLKNIVAIHVGANGAVVPLADAMPGAGGDSTDDSTDDESMDEGAIRPEGNIAVIHLCGTLMKQQSSMDESTSTVVVRRQVRMVKDDPRFAGAIICMDSPGGTVAGTSDLAADIADLAEAKPVIGLVEDLCASACYWCGSQCTELYASNGTALVGSIGTLIATYDYSKWAEQEGIEAKVYATGDLKAAGFPGAKITPEQDAYFQTIVDETQKYFVQGVATGRGMSIESVNKAATGAVYLAGEAQDLGLIDGIKSFDDCLARMSELLAQRQQASTSPGATAGASQEIRMKTDSGKPAADAGTATAAPISTPATASADTKAELKRFTEAFGAANGASWYLEGKTFDEATALNNQASAEAMEALRKENLQLRSQNDQLQARVRETRGELTPVSADLEPDPNAKDTRNVRTLENRIGPNLAAFARSIKLPKDN
ncbi:MAG TPA: S49 family peptidase [Phycisphaerae bacterium]|nr:S49 family peptidase [Phycisphaerae bacterium]